MVNPIAPTVVGAFARAGRLIISWDSPLMDVMPHSGTRFVVKTTGFSGSIVGPAEDEYWAVILDGIDDVTEFALDHLEFATAGE